VKHHRNVECNCFSPTIARKSSAPQVCTVLCLHVQAAGDDPSVRVHKTRRGPRRLQKKPIEIGPSKREAHKCGRDWHPAGKMNPCKTSESYYTCCGLKQVMTMTYPRDVLHNTDDSLGISLSQQFASGSRSSRGARYENNIIVLCAVNI
jgi:hypothetical protein